MGEAEPDGCYFGWGEHTCLEDLGHEGDHECSCGATHESTVQDHTDRSRDA